MRGLVFLVKPKILSWDVRGLNDPNKHLRIKSIFCNWKVDIVCLQEMKLLFMDIYIIISLLWCFFLRWPYLVSMGA